MKWVAARITDPQKQDGSQNFGGKERNGPTLEKGRLNEVTEVIARGGMQQTFTWHDFYLLDCTVRCRRRRESADVSGAGHRVGAPSRRGQVRRHAQFTANRW